MAHVFARCRVTRLNATGAPWYYRRGTRTFLLAVGGASVAVDVVSVVALLPVVWAYDAVTADTTARLIVDVTDAAGISEGWVPLGVRVRERVLAL